MYALIGIDGDENKGFAILDDDGNEIATTDSPEHATMIVDALNGSA